MGEARAKQLADRIQVLVAELLERRVKDPRLGFVTVTDARLTGDLREASVFYTVYGDEQARSETAAALESAKGLIRSEVGKALGLRHTPSVEFFLDAVPETAGHIEELLAKARLLRDGNVVADNLDLASLRREKDDVSEVREGFECGVVLRGYNDIKEGDVIESFEMREIPRA